ncbi:charged multivesicular body protein 7 [Frankliniella occidentalis]|uniref:Charged multivesicular body protein 7 n=1 Tax=Frankliniella occidentalis TaxID=133901 RepID=A0A6J1T8R9_FRAOC|nr:charged multivesicular body protein 7 [Frankliniella occidentalis]XP_026289693.1 charged multivesicular body protein 7 [Frankliniella occidentalis]
MATPTKGASLSTHSQEFPELWEDETRMTSLFAPFRDRDLNPQGWDSKFSFWTAMVLKWSERKNRISFSLDELNKDFMRNGRIPECLPTVLEEMQRSRSIVQPEEFLKMCNVPDSWRGWMFDIAVKKPASWTFTKLKGMVVSPSAVTNQTQFVHLAAIKTRSEAIFSSAGEDLRGELMTIHNLLSACGMENVPSTDARFIAYYLQYQGYAAVTDQDIDKTNKSQILIKLRSSNMKSKPTITDVDRGIYTLSCNEKALLHYLERLENEKQDTLKQAKAYLAKGMRSTAKSCLRKKKELERVIEKRSNALDNVQVLLARIRDASSDSQVLESYQVGVAALKKTFKAAGLTEDDVANTMDDVKEVLDTHNEIQALLAEPVDSNTDEGLEEELSDLLAEESAPTSGPGPGGNLDDSDKDLQDRLQQLRFNDSLPQLDEEKTPSLLHTPRAVTLDDLPSTPRNMPTPEYFP